jgi:hypothetical protein
MLIKIKTIKVSMKQNWIIQDEISDMDPKQVAACR